MTLFATGKFWRVLVAGALILGFGAASAQPDGYPAKPIKWVVPTPVGTPIDIISRLVALKMGEELKQAIVVENKPGATGAVGAQAVLQAPADGYTIMIGFMPMTVAPAIYAKVPFDLRKDFQAVGQTAWSYNVLVVPPALNVGSTRELVDLLKSKPGQLSFASGGWGTPAHTLAVLFEAQSGTSAIHAPYPGGQSVTNLIGGQHAYMFLAVPSAMGGIQGGQLRPLAVAADQRLPNLPNVPTVAEQGYPALAARDWQGLLVRQGTSPDIIARLNGALGKALANVQVRDTMVKLGAQAAPGSADEFAALIAKELVRWAEVARAANLKVE
jgi:tripartite-type tricarboxylate transporter receptor subunit TctC